MKRKYEIRKFLTENEKNFNLNLEQAGIWAHYNPMIEFLSNLVIVIVIVAGGLMIINEHISIGVLVAFSNYIYMLIWPMRLLDGLQTC